MNELELDNQTQFAHTSDWPRLSLACQPLASDTYKLIGVTSSLTKSRGHKFFRSTSSLEINQGGLWNSLDHLTESSSFLWSRQRSKHLRSVRPVAPALKRRNFRSSSKRIQRTGDCASDDSLSGKNTDAETVYHRPLQCSYVPDELTVTESEVPRSIRASRSKLFPEPSNLVVKNRSPRLSQCPLAPKPLRARSSGPISDSMRLRFSKSHFARRAVAPAVKDYGSLSKTQACKLREDLGVSVGGSDIHFKALQSIRLQGIDLPSIHVACPSESSPKETLVAAIPWEKSLEDRVSDWGSKKKNQKKLRPNLPSRTESINPSPFRGPATMQWMIDTGICKPDEPSMLPENVARPRIVRRDAWSKIPIKSLIACERKTTLRVEKSPLSPPLCSGRIVNLDLTPRTPPTITTQSTGRRSATPLSAHLEDFAQGLTKAYRVSPMNGTTTIRRRVSRNITPLSENELHLNSGSPFDNEFSAPQLVGSGDSKKRDNISSFVCFTPPVKKPIRKRIRLTQPTPTGSAEL